VPTYQYACTECGHGFEAVQSFSDDALTECPQCQGRLRKVFSSVGIVFKGSGFYRNDSREKARAGSSDSSTSDSSKSDSSTSGAKADLKPDSTPAKSDAPAAKSTATTSTESSGRSAAGGGVSKPSRSSTEGSAA
jgi:putative FmdB family regulatory protein